MRRYPIFLSLFLSLFIPVFSSAQDEIMPLDQVKRGMKGIGKTVFSGTKVDDFEVEVLGVMRNISPGRNMILIKMAGGPLAETGIISGMSGSPIYIDGKLVGAISAGWLYPKQPMGLVTPIEEMIEVWDRKATSEERSSPSFKALAAALRNGKEEGFGEIIPSVEVPAMGGASFKRLSLPLVLSGFRPDVVDRLSPIFEKLGFIPIQGGGKVSIPEGEKPELEPGAAVGVEIMRGDIQAYSYGTLTYRKGNMVLAYGHSMTGQGDVSFPMSTVYIYSIFPSVVRSFKIGAVADVVGVISQDRYSAISGEIGREPEMVPVEITVKPAFGSKPRSFRAEVVKDRFWLPSMVFSGVWDAILSWSMYEEGDWTLSIKSRVDIRGHKPLLMEELYSGGSSVPLLASLDLGTNLADLVDNPFERAQIERISVEVSVLERIEIARIESIRAEKDSVKPGDSLDIYVTLRPYLQDERIEKVSIPIPDDVPEGPLEIRVVDGKSAIQLEMARAPMRFSPTNLDQLIELLGSMPSANEMVIDAFLRKPGVVIKGREMPSIPSSVLSVLYGSGQSGEISMTQGISISRIRLKMPFRIIGARMILVNISRMAR